jgi:di/tricarboxylate transporter
MTWEAWLTLGVVALCFGLLMSNRYAPDSVLMGGLTLLLVAGVVSPEQALAGLANEGMVTVGVLYIVAAGLRETGAIAWLGETVLGRPRGLVGAQLRLMGPVAALSAFLNNTPVVAMFIPAVGDWAKRYGLPPSRLLMPLSFAAIAGGTCTLIGTSTNLVVNGLLKTEAGHPGLGLLDIAAVGLPVTLAVVGFVLLTGRRLLPDRGPAMAQFADPRQYTVEMLVEAGSPLEGKSVEQAGLRQLPGMFLVEVERGGRLIPVVGPEERLAGGDRLVFAGVVESVVDLRRIRGLVPATDQVFKLASARHARLLVEAVVSDTCPLVGKSIREGRFRTVYNAAVIAVARNGERIRRKLGDIVLKPGDTLLLEAHPSFAEQQHNSRDFFLVSHVEGSEPPRHDRALLAAVIVAAMVASVVAGLFSMLQAAMLAAGLLILGGCLSGRIARRAVDWSVLVVIAASFGIGAALGASGAAAALAGSLVDLAGGSPHAALALVFVVTAVFSALVTNNAAAVLMFPIAQATAADLDVSLLPFAITLMMAASASFATPIAYQTNLMVYGPGGYRFTDYLRLGIPLTLLVGVLTVLLAPIFWPF